MNGFFYFKSLKNNKRITASILWVQKFHGNSGVDPGFFSWGRGTVYFFELSVRARGWGSPLPPKRGSSIWSVLTLKQKSNTDKLILRYFFCMPTTNELQNQQDFVLMSDSASAPKHRSSYTSCSNSCSNYYGMLLLQFLYSILPKAVTDKTFAAPFTWWTKS